MCSTDSPAAHGQSEQLVRSRSLWPALAVHISPVIHMAIIASDNIAPQQRHGLHPCPRRSDDSVMHEVQVAWPAQPRRVASESSASVAGCTGTSSQMDAEMLQRCRASAASMQSTMCAIACQHAAHVKQCYVGGCHPVARLSTAADSLVAAAC
jgi:hypothetical protein